MNRGRKTTTGTFHLPQIITQPEATVHEYRFNSVNTEGRKMGIFSVTLNEKCPDGLFQLPALIRQLLTLTCPKFNTQHSYIAACMLRVGLHRQCVCAITQESDLKTWR